MDLGDFLVQIPSGLILMVCGSGLLFVISVLIIAQRHNQRKIRRANTPPSAVPALENDSAPVAEAAPADAGPGVLSRAWKGVHDFFFYSEEERAARESAKAQAAAQSGTPADPAGASISAPPDTVEVLHLWRDVVDGSLIIQIGDEHFRTMGDIAAAGQERRFMTVLRELARIAKETAGEVTIAPQAPADGASAPAEDPEPESLPTPEVEAMIRAAQKDVPRPSLTSDVQSSYSEPEPEPLGSFFENVRNAVRRGGRAPAKGPEAPSLSIADEIEEFLQNQLRSASPEIQGHSIHVRPALDGGVRIEVDGHFFETVGDIVDEDIRAYMIDTIQAWEAAR